MFYESIHITMLIFHSFWLWLCVLLLTECSKSTFAFRSIDGNAVRYPLRTKSSTTVLRVAMPFQDDDHIPSSIAPEPTWIRPNQLGQLDPEDAWIAKLDYQAFGTEVSALGKELRSSGGTDDVEHLYKLIGWRNVFAILGLATVWTAPNPLTILALSTWTYSSWALVAHHTCHGGYNKVDAGDRFKSRQFAQGQINRFVDWLDWIQTEAWNVEHNRLHHYNLNEERDPDLVQRNLSELRENKDLPVMAKYAFVLGAMLFWKWFYYAPNTYKELRINELLLQKNSGGAQLPENFDRLQSATIKDFLDPFSHFGKALRRIAPLDVLLFDVMGPMLVGRFVLLPLVIWAIGGPMLAQHAIWNLLAAELLTNVHSFVTIVTNHGTCLDRF